MKPIRKIIVIVTVLIGGIILLFLTQSGKATPEPSISIISGDQIIKPIYYGDRYNETREDIERFLDFPFENSTWEQLPYVSIGDEVVITLENFEAEEFKIYDDLLAQDGTFLYSEKSTTEFDLNVENGEVRFTVPSNPWVHLSSNSESYEPGHVIRAFTIRTEINKSKFAFAFVIRTNP